MFDLGIRVSEVFSTLVVGYGLLQLGALKVQLGSGGGVVEGFRREIGLGGLAAVVELL